MTSESMVLGRRNTVLAAVIGTVLASYAGSATALEFEFDNGGRLNWNTTLSVGASWRAEDPARRLYTRADGSALGLYNAPLIPGTFLGPDDGLAGNHAAGDGNLNYAKGDRFTTPFKLITDLEYKKDRWGGLVRVKAWYDQALNEEKVRYGSQANEYNGVRKGLGPVPGYRLCSATESANWNRSLNCMPVSPPGQNLWPQAKLSDKGFEAEQKFDNVYLLDAYVYGSFDIGETDLQLRLGRQVINWGESIFIQGVNQTNPIDVPAARRAGAELKEILMPVEMLYFNWGLPVGSLEAFYQIRWDNTSVDACGTYFTATSTLVGADPGSCRSLTPIGAPAWSIAYNGVIVPQLGSLPYIVSGTGLYVPAVKGIEPSDSGQFGLAFRFPVDAIDTEIGLYGMNIHSRLPYTGGQGGTSPNDLPAPIKGALTAAGIIGTDAYGPYWASGTSRVPQHVPGPRGGHRGRPQGAGNHLRPAVGRGLLAVPRGHPDLRHQRRDQPVRLVHVGRAELPAGRAGADQRQRRARCLATSASGRSARRRPRSMRARPATGPRRLRPLRQDAGAAELRQDVQQLPRRRQHRAGGRSGRPVERHPELQERRPALRPRLHVRHRLGPRVRPGRLPAGPDVDPADQRQLVLAHAGGGADPDRQHLVQPASGRLPQRRLRHRHGVGLPPARVG